jgi:hypothetical protein
MCPLVLPSLSQKSTSASRAVSPRRCRNNWPHVAESSDAAAAPDEFLQRDSGKSQQAEIEATTIPPTNALESALLQTLAPGNYTAIVRGKNNTTGVGLVAAYNLHGKGSGFLNSMSV